MPTLHERMMLLSREPRTAAGRVLAAALGAAERNERRALAAAAVATGQPEAVAAVIGCLHELGPAGPGMLGKPRLPLDTAIGIIRRRGGDRALANAIAVVRRLADASLLHHLAGVIEAGDDDHAARLAGEALLEVVLRLAGRDGRGKLAPGIAERLDAAVARAVAVPATRGPGGAALAAALLARRPGPELGRILDDDQHPAAFALRRAAGGTDNELVRVNLIRWIAVPALGRAALRALHRLGDVREHGDALQAGHLLLAPARRRALRRVHRPAHCLPDDDAAPSLPPACQVNLVRLVRALPLAGAERTARLAGCAALPSPIARLRAAEALAARGGDAAGCALEQLTGDPDPRVAWIAAERAFEDPAAPLQRLGRLEACPHAAIAQRAAAAAACRSAASFFEHWMTIGPARRIAAARMLLAGRRRELLAGLEKALAGGPRHERLAAIGLLRRLGAVGDAEAALIASARDPDAHVAASAVLALADGAAASPRRLGAVRDAFARAQPRIRANAVEALMRVEPAATGHLGGLAGDPDNRLRANAIRALLRAAEPGGADRLRDMLADAAPRHRVSALWVARHSRLGPDGRVLKLVRRLARRDGVAELRGRAAATARWLEHRRAGPRRPRSERLTGETA